MLGPEDFVVIVAVMAGIAVAGVLAVGLMHRRGGGTPPDARPRRDVIAEGAVKERDLAAMHEAENARLKAQGHKPISRAELEARVVGDRKFKGRLMRLRMRRRPERARPLA